MPGTTRIHNIICFQLRMLLEQLLKGKGYEMYSESVKVQIIPGRNYAYPDLIVTNDPRDLTGEDVYLVKHPIAIFEVLSKNTRMVDQVDKFIRYQNIDSLRDYVLVDSEQPWVEVRSKMPDGQWEAAAYGPSSDAVVLPSLGVKLSFADIYPGTTIIG
jgi:Uncharacterized protein conserved in cyanobacteria